MEAHVGPLTRSIDGEVPQGHRRDPVICVIEITKLFSRELRHAVWGHRLRQRVLAHGHGDEVPVHRRARRVYDPLDVWRPRNGFEQHLRRFDVVHCVDAEVGTPAFANTCLSREMKDMRTPGQDAAEIGVLNGRFDEREARTVEQAGQVALLYRSRVVIRKAVEADDLGTVGDKAFSHRRADEPGGAREESFHAKSPLTRSGRRHGRPSRSMVAWTVRPVTSVCASVIRTTSYVNATRAGDASLASVRISSSSSYRAGRRY